METQIRHLQEQIKTARTSLLTHPVYTQINDLEGLKKFTEFHVFAVWDFMSLLKSLQMGLTCVTLPWLPVGSANTRYLINEIVTGEESDVDALGNRISHFELYLQAMDQMGANAAEIKRMVSQLQSGQTIQKTIQDSNLSNKVKQFLSFTFDIAQNAPLHVKAAVFTFGREDLIPDMFSQILNEIYSTHPEKVSIFKYYIERHIEVDGGHHSQLALEMVAELCGNDPLKWEEATAASIQSLEVRSGLWDAIIEH